MHNHEEADHLQASLANYFGARSLERAAERREDHEWLSAKLKDHATRIVPMQTAQNLFAADHTPVFFSPHDFPAGLEALQQAIFLCEEEGAAYFAVDLVEIPEMAILAQRRGEFGDLKARAALLPAREAAVLAYARAMLHWQRTHRFCGACGTRTHSFSGGHMRQCASSACGRQLFPRTDPAIIVLVTHGARTLLARQAKWPERVFSTLAGFVEPGETLEAAVMREVWEEAGVRLFRIHYHSSQPWPFPASIMLGFHAQALSMDLRLNSAEISEAAWWTRAELRAAVQLHQIKLPTEVSIARRLIQDWLDTETKDT
ncbi:MAG: NAD(+) diphosphatase [bacterium]